MTAPGREWQPGDPLLTDNGCGSIPAVTWTPQERQAATHEGDRTPPWYRPTSDATSVGWNRHCKPCDVQWRGDGPCWMCDGEDMP